VDQTVRIISGSSVHPDFFGKVGHAAEVHEVVYGDQISQIVTVPIVSTRGHQTAVYCNTADVVRTSPETDAMAPVRQSYSGFHHQVPSIRKTLGCGPEAETLELIQHGHLMESASFHACMLEASRRLKLTSDVCQFAPTETTSLHETKDIDLTRGSNAVMLQDMRNRLADARLALMPVVACGHYTAICATQLLPEVWACQYYDSLPVQHQGCKEAASRVAQRLGLFGPECSSLPDSEPGIQSDGWSCGIHVLQWLESKARSFLGEPVMPLITIQACIHRGNEFIQKVSPTAMAASRSAEAKKETKAPETMVEAVEAAQACTKCRVTRAGFKGCTKCMGSFFQVYKGQAKTKAKAKGKASDQLEETQT
jgi:hypothetical protein